MLTLQTAADGLRTETPIPAIMVAFVLVDVFITGQGRERVLSEARDRRGARCQSMSTRICWESQTRLVRVA